jgi:hypothetical protein
VKNTRFKLTFFFPITEAEQEHIKDLINLLGCKKQGDYLLIAQMVDMNVELVKKSLVRITSKDHLRVFEALKKIVDSRKKLLTGVPSVGKD